VSSGALPATPEMHELPAPAGWQCIDLISDLHLQAGMPRTFEAWRHHLLHTPADAVLILGDLFEVWIGDDAADEGFEHECAEVLRAAAARCWVGFMAGNRDFLVGGRLLDGCGVHLLPDPTVLAFAGRRYLLSHGDALCLDDEDYQRFRAQVRQPAWTARFLAQPLAVRRQVATQMREASEARKRTQGPESYGDLHAEAALAWLRAARADAFIHGHTHRPADHALAPGVLRHVMSDWDLDHARPPRAEVLRLTRDGMQRIPPA
jgi:UDP-2,3-diacylglucosamine hydrolase